MKKCPYCYTLMNDDVEVCPNCLKDMKTLSPMGEVAPKENKISFYSLIFGGIISIGSLIASFSVRANRFHYKELFDDVKANYDIATDATIKADLQKQGEALLANIKTCEFKEVAFYVMCGIGICMVLYSLIVFFMKKYRKVKKD